MIKLTKMIAATLLIPLAAGSAHAANPYTDCGIGAALFPNTHWAAVSSNVIWDLGVTAIISGVSSPETCNSGKTETAMLILETLPQLEKDIARGQGKNLVALNEIVGCSASQQDRLNLELRAAYAPVAQSSGYAQLSQVDKASNIYDSVRDLTSATGMNCSVAL